jgi:hypothetical protein
MSIRLTIASAAMLVFGGSLFGQGITPGSRFQINWASPFGTNVTSLDEAFNNRVIKGKPFSATEERHSVQVLGNGTRIESTQSNRLFRDSDGRTRVEDMSGKVAIWDAVAGFRVELDPATKVARRGNINLPVQFLGVAVNFQDQVNPARRASGEVTESLKAQTINGVMAQGTRVTTTIPRNQIGNDRDIVVITERWVSSDLQMLVKSLNSDPRFGDTTYELTKIVQGPQSASLFEIPPDYTVPGNAGPGRNSRGGGAPGAPAPPNGGGARSGGGRGAPPNLDPRLLPPGQRPVN